MIEFNGDKFLLENRTSEYLYSRYASGMPIMDYHCHLSPREIAENKTFLDIGEMFLELDHYKWRLMRIAGVPEEFITGNASYKEKFKYFAKSLELAIGNPLYHWTHMELKCFFSITEPLTEKNADIIYEKANKFISDGHLTVESIFEKLKVMYVATTDDPVDSLEFHGKIRNINDYKAKVIPTFRPDKIFKIRHKDFVRYIQKLSECSEMQIMELKDLFNSLTQRMDYFESFGCNSSDHGLDYVPDSHCDFEEADIVFKNALSGKCVSEKDADKFIWYMLVNLAKEYKQRNWVMQIHLSVIRDQNYAQVNNLGSDSGFDSIGNVVNANSINMLFNEIEKISGMPKTILFTLNPISNYILATAAGNFSTKIPGKVQIGTAWWFCDNKDGIRENLKVFANTGILGLFNGMLTDSRSFTSYVRHDYFRRILCSYIGELIENGEFPSDDEYIKVIIENICYNNAKRFFQKDY